MDSRGFGERKTLKLHERKESKALGGGGGMQSPPGRPGLRWQDSTICILTGERERMPVGAEKFIGKRGCSQRQFLFFVTSVR